MHCWTPVRSQVVVITSGRPLSPSRTSDQHVLHAPVLQLGEDLRPEPCALTAVTGQIPMISRSPLVLTPTTP